jgi:hypothetical protein
VDANTLTEALDPIEIPGFPEDVLFIPDGLTAYISDANGRVYVYDRQKARICGASATVPEFLDIGAISDPAMDEVRPVDCLARTETWTVTYDQETRNWIVHGTQSGTQAARAVLDQSYVSDEGAIQFTIRSGSRAPSDGDEFRFDTDVGIAPVRTAQLPEGMTVVNNVKDVHPGYYVVWVANALSDSLTRITTNGHKALGAYDN